MSHSVLRRKVKLDAPGQNTSDRAVAKRRTKQLPPDEIPVLQIYHASPLRRIELVKGRVHAAAVKRLFAEWNIGQGDGFRALNLSTATVNKKAKQADVLTQDESERVIGFARLVGQVAAMIEDSGNAAGFDAPAWLSRWLREPLPVFGGVRPADLIDTMEGQGLVAAALASLQSGVYA